MLGEKVRESNVELCRIVCMCLIIAHHSVVHSGVLAIEPSIYKLIAIIFLPAGKICFDAFIVISCWFLVEKEFKVERFLKIWLQVLFYAVFMAFISGMLGGGPQDREWGGVFLPILGNSHGFAVTYLAFYLLLPFLGLLLSVLDEKKLKILIVILFNYEVISRFIHFLIDYKLNLISDELTLFVLIYYICALLKRTTNRYIEDKTVMVSSLLCVWLMIYVICILSFNYGNKLWCQFLMGLVLDESGILYIVGGFLMFFAFKNIKLKSSSIINFISRATFGILLFHDNSFFRPILWNEILYASDWIETPYVILWILCDVFLIYIGGLLIDMIRMWGMELIFKSKMWGKIMKNTIR